MHVINANGAAIPAIGLGTWTLRDEPCAELVAAALQTGYRHVDTAAAYGNEEAVGRGIRAGGVTRDDIFLTTKVWYTNIGPGDLERSVEASLKRLDVGPVDLVLIHWPNPEVPLDLSIGALNAVRKAGLTRHIGVSNFSPKLLKQAMGYSEAPLVCNQVEYHPYLDQSKVHAACRAASIAMVSYCPLFRGGALFEEAVIRDAASRHGKTPGQIVLRWHVQQEGVVAIPRTTKRERLVENLAVFDFALSAAEMEAISALSPANQRLCEHDFPMDWNAE